MDRRLTKREWDVLRLLAERLSNKAIAKRLHCSIHTAKNHVHHVISKLNADNRLDAVRIGMGINLRDETRCDICPISSKADVVSSDLRRLADELSGGK